MSEFGFCPRCGADLETCCRAPECSVIPKSQALVVAHAALTDLKEYFAHRFAQLLKTKGVRYDDFEFDVVSAYAGPGSGPGILLRTEYYSHGDTDRDEHFFPLSDLDVDVDELNRRENERIEKERADAAAREVAYKARVAAATEQVERNEYKRLKAKYGD
jgi:hypothetical protein